MTAANSANAGNVSPTTPVIEQPATNGVLTPDPIAYVDNGTQQYYRGRPTWIIKVTDTNTGAAVYTEGNPANRRITGEGGTLPFGKSEAVVGGLIHYNDGRQSTGLCYEPVAEMDGTVTSGAINPWGAETDGRSICVFQSPPPPAPPPAPPPSPSPPQPTATPGQYTPPRTPTGEGNWVRFNFGTSVVGATIQYWDQYDRVLLEMHNCWEPYTPTGGWVNSGVLWPNDNDVARVGGARCPRPQGY